MHSILTVNNKIPISCKLFYWPVNSYRSIARYRTVDRWPYFHWFNKSHDIDVDGRGYWKHLKDMWVERVNKKILKRWKCITKQLLTGSSDDSSFVRPSNGSVNCPQPAASGNRSVRGSNKTAVVLEPSQ